MYTATAIRTTMMPSSVSSRYFMILFMAFTLYADGGDECRESADVCVSAVGAGAHCDAWFRRSPEYHARAGGVHRGHVHDRATSFRGHVHVHDARSGAAMYPVPSSRRRRVAAS